MRPRFTASCDDKGLWTARAEYSCIKGDFESAQIQSKLVRGTSLASISTSEIGTAWSFLAVDTVEAVDEPGGITVVTISFKGYNEEQWDFDADKSKTYTRNATTFDDSIFNHKQFKEDVVGADLDTFIKAVAGMAYRRADSSASTIYVVGNNGSDKIINTLTDPDVIEWWGLVVDKKHETYKVPTMEWTLSTTGRNKLSAADLSDLGYISTPQGSPGTPTGRNWLMTGATESIQVVGEGANSYSITWLLSGPEPWPDKIYKKPSP